MKVSGTIDNDLCAWMRKKIEERSFYNQSHAIELGLKKLRDEDGGNTTDGKGRR